MKRERGLGRRGAGSGTKLSPQPGGKPGHRGEEAGLEPGRQARDALPRPPPPPRSPAGEHREGGGLPAGG